MRKIMTLGIVLTIITLILSGCSKGIEGKKEITIKDIIDDKKMHMLYMTGMDDDDGEYSTKVNGIYLTKDGKIKLLELDEDSDISVEFIKKFQADEVEEGLGNAISEKTGWKSVTSYGMLTTPNGKPLFTTFSTGKMSKEEIKSMEFSENNELGFVYNTITTQPSQNPQEDKNTSYGAFSLDMSAISGSTDTDSSTMQLGIMLDDDKQKLIDLDSKDKSVITVKASGLQ